jgi:outer membrane immunogenic protein
MFRVCGLSRAIFFSCASGLLTCAITVPSNAQSPYRPLSWSGLYFGVHAGGAAGTVDSLNVASSPCPDTPNFCTTPSQHPTGGLAGGQIGYNWVFDGLLLGLEADLSVANIRDRVPDGNFITQHTKIGALGTARARLGAQMGNFMPYLTGGLAFGQLTSGENCPPNATGGWCLPSRHGTYSLEQTNWETGWTIGAGLEVAFSSRWTLKAEYMFVDFGSQRHVLDPLGVVSNPNPPRPSASDRNADWTLHLVRAGVNYKF